MELTKQDKHEIYKKILIDLESNKFVFCCCSFEKIIESAENPFVFLGKCPQILSELYELRTFSYSNIGPWFNNK